MFLALSFFYILTNPPAFIAINLIRIAAVARIVHTLVYAVMPMQPARAIAYLTCLVITIFMSLATAVHFYWTLCSMSMIARNHQNTFHGHTNTNKRKSSSRCLHRIHFQSSFIISSENISRSLSTWTVQKWHRWSTQSAMTMRSFELSSFGAQLCA